MAKLSLFFFLVFFISFSSPGYSTAVFEANINRDCKVVNSSFTKQEAMEGQNRLTPEQLLVYFPEKIGNYERSDEAMTDAARKSTSGSPFSQAILSYYPPASSNSLVIKVEDYGDDPKRIESGKGKFRGSEYRTGRQEMVSFVNENDLREFHEGKYLIRGEDTLRTRTNLQLSNPRFNISITSQMVDQNMPALSYQRLEEIIYATDLAKLFNLPFDFGQETMATDEGMSIDCDGLLPAALLNEVCGVENVKLTITDFEKKSNCNRVYKNGDGNNIGGLYFQVTNYTETGMARKAMQAKLNDTDLDYQQVDGLGETAGIVKIEDAYYLSFSAGNMLVEIRSVYSGLDKKENCCLCYSKEKVIDLARQIFNNL